MSAWGTLSPSLRLSIGLVCERLKDCGAAWLIGGSCGLLLQDVALSASPRDIDLYVNRGQMPVIHERLREWALEEPQYSETPIYRSTLGHYDISGHTLEVVGGFEVETIGSFYVVDVELLERFAQEACAEDGCMKLMPLAHELLFNILRRRPDRYEAIAAAMRANLQRHEPALRELLRQGRWSAEVRDQVRAALEG